MIESDVWMGPDPMMDELHQIRCDIQEELKDKSDAEKVQWYHEQTILAADSIGCDLVPSGRGYKMVPRAQLATPEVGGQG